MKVNVRYGREGLKVELPDDDDVTVLQTKQMPVPSDPDAELRKCLERPVGSPPLKEMATGKKNACIVISDITRPVPNKTLLPPILEVLEQAGIEPERIRLLVATGIHRAPSESELVEILGNEIRSKYPIFSHSARDASCIARVGYTSNGTPVDVNRLYLESRLKILTGLVEPHFMAGYSGGRKSVAVGLTSLDSIKHLHGTKFLEHPGSRNCRLAGNPLHAELTEMAVKAGADFCVNAVVDAGRRIGGIFAGDMVEAHDLACDFAGRYVTTKVEKPFDLVVTSAAGYPLDATYYQAVKGFVGALDILSPGGGIILASECSMGLGSDEFRLMLGRLGGSGSLDRFIEHISKPDNFMIDQWEVEMLVKALRKGRLYLYSTGIAEDDWALTHAARVESVEKGVSLAASGGRERKRMAVIPEGPYCVPSADHGKSFD